MSYEAVPCKIRAPSQDGTNGTKEIIGIIIRPSNSQEGSRVSVPLPTSPAIIPIKGSNPFIIGPGSSKSLIISNDKISKSSVHCKKCEGADEETKFDDMPRLSRIDHHNSAACSTGHSLSLSTLDESSTNQASECESALPSSISKCSWNPQEIASQLLSMAAFDPAKIEEVTSLMLKRSKEDEEKKERQTKRKIENSQSTIDKKKIRNAQFGFASTSKEYERVDRYGGEASEDDQKRSESEPREEAYNLVIYRSAMKRRMIDMVEETMKKVMDNLSLLSIGEKRKKINHQLVNPMFRTIQWELINSKPRQNLLEIVVNEINERRKERTQKEKRGRRNKGEETLIVSRKWTKEQSKEFKIMKRRGDEHIQPYITIHKNVMVSRTPIVPLSLPSYIRCECARGRCLSSDCIHRSCRLFCTPSTCLLPSCSNRLSIPSALYLSKGVLKTKEPTKAHIFLGEMVGEIISVSAMIERLSSTCVSPESHIKSFSLTPYHFLDSTRKGSIIRHVRHSCQSNAILQIWWEKGTVHLCLFSRLPLASNSEITVDLSFFTPTPFECSCSSPECRRSIPPSTVISLHKSIHSMQSSRHFLKRNLRVRRINNDGEDKILCIFYLIIDHLFRRTDGKVHGRQFAQFLYKLRRASSEEKMDLFTAILWEMEQLTQRPMDTHSLRCIRRLLDQRLERKNEGENERKKFRKMEKNSNRCTNIAYLDSRVAVGSYNPDVWKGANRSTEDSVRCVCGVLEDDGEMVECEECHFWLHCDCVTSSSIDSYSCPLCVAGTSTPQGDILLKNQPNIRLDGCAYYKALENKKKLQIRQNECVYVRRLKSDNHKKILRGLEHKKVKCGDALKEVQIMCDDDQMDTVPPRSSLRVFRVERLFESPRGHRFLFGFYYARPHETFCDENRLFHPNEVFATPFYDTLPLDAVEGKCVVMETSLYCEGRPLFPAYKEQDVLVCEYQLDRQQRHFDKCKNTYFINTELYAFKKFERPRSLQRCFTPFTFSPSPIITTWSQEDACRFLFQHSKKRINRIAKRLTTDHV